MKYILTIALTIIIAAFAYPVLAGAGLLKQGQDLMETKPENYPSVTFAGGCFWCTESEFRGIDGVLFTRVGYMGGELKNPTYQDITTGRTGHAEVIEVTYDPKKTSFKDLTRFFLTKAHDPTQLNRQGVDVGTQYRSAIFYADEEQKKIAAELIQEIDAEGIYDKPIVTTLEPLSTFWLGEGYHQQYYEKYKEEKGQDHIRVILKKAGKLK